MSDEHLLESQVGSELVFQGRLLHVYRDEVRLPDQSLSVREYIRHPGAAVMVAVAPDGRLLFERQFRYPVGQVMLELPAGKIDSAEPSLQTAIRELREETGYASDVWTYLGCMHTCIGYSNERIDIFLAENIRQEGGPQLDEGEFLECLFFTPAEAKAMIGNGLVTDAKTITALYFAEMHWARQGAEAATGR